MKMNVLPIQDKPQSYFQFIIQNIIKSQKKNVEIKHPQKKMWK